MKYLAAALSLALALIATSASAAVRHSCAKCAPEKKYDSQQVVRAVKTIDRSRVINTTSVVYRPKFVAPRSRSVTRAYAPAIAVNFVVQKYRITHGPHPDAATRTVSRVGPRCKHGVSRPGSCVLRVRG
jgi:hypothetical protein